MKKLRHHLKYIIDKLEYEGFNRVTGTGTTSYDVAFEYYPSGESHYLTT